MSITKRPLLLLLSPLLILIVPLIAMQISEEVNWSLLDFIVAGLLLLLASFGAYYLPQLFKNSITKFIIALAVIGTILLIWAELAVGLL